MNIDDFWCRAFLAAMGGTYTQGGVGSDHGEAAIYAGMAADAALAVAKRRGMIAGALPGDAVPADPPRSAPTLERVEFTAERYVGETGLWQADVHGVGVYRLWPGEERAALPDGPVIHIKWGETSPPKPIEVWLERPAAISPAPPGMSDAEVAAEFYRRFRPVRVLVGDMAARTAFAEDDHGSWLSGVRSSGGSIGEHPAGEPGFVSAVLRARDLVRKGGGS